MRPATYIESKLEPSPLMLDLDYYRCCGTNACLILLASKSKAILNHTGRTVLDLLISFRSSKEYHVCYGHGM